jgi:hypothetical protein
MRNGVCPKCNSNSVYATNAADGNFTLPTVTHDALIATAVSVQRVSSERYVCTACGYFETYVASREFLDFIPTSSVWIKV